MEAPTYIVQLRAADDAAHAALDALQSESSHVDATAIAHALDGLLWAIAAHLAFVADNADAQSSSGFADAATQVNAVASRLLELVGHPGAPASSRADDFLADM